jgi:DNA-binding IclR family transcriptional regulator
MGSEGIGTKSKGAITGGSRADGDRLGRRVDSAPRTASSKAGSPDDPQTACARVLGVLSAFSFGGALLSLSEISRRAGLSLTTTHRLVGELTEWGALERDDERFYRIGIRLLELAMSSSRGLELRDIAMPYLEELHALTRENVHLSVRVGQEVVYIERLRALGGIEVLIRIGGRWPMPATGTGLVLLAYAPHDVQEEVLGSPLERYTPMTICDGRTLRGVLAEVRRTTVAVTLGQITPGSLSVAAPIRGGQGDVVAAVGVVVRAGSCPQGGLASAVTRAALRISQALAASRSDESTASFRGPVRLSDTA